MLNATIVRTVEFCTRHVWGVIILALILATVSGTHTVRHFSIDTNVNNLISRDLPWRKRELEYQAAFPQSRQLIPLRPRRRGRGVFQQNRLLFLSTEQVVRITNQLANAEPIIGVLAKPEPARARSDAFVRCRIEVRQAFA